MKQTLADVEASINRFISEARMCAEGQCGFAAMLTAFPVILGVSEAVSGKQTNDALFKWFMSQMDDRDSWILLPESVTFEEADVGEKLSHIRDSLAHQFSLPLDVVMVNSIAEVKDMPGRDSDKYFVGTREFVDAIQRTVGKIVESHPDAVLDPHPRDVRGAASRVPLTGDARSTSGSSAGEVISSASVSQFTSPVHDRGKTVRADDGAT
jgi:hypothetical protein